MLKAKARAARFGVTTDKSILNPAAVVPAAAAPKPNPLHAAAASAAAAAVATATRDKKRKQPFQGLANPLHAPAASAAGAAATATAEAAPVDPELEARKKARADRFGLSKA